MSTAQTAIHVSKAAELVPMAAQVAVQVAEALEAAAIANIMPCILAKGLTTST